MNFRNGMLNLGSTTIRVPRRIKEKTLRSIAMVVACLWFSLDCDANNNLFLPGDAFFPTEMTKEDVDVFSTSSQDSRSITYVAIDRRGGAFCGWAGFQNAIVKSADDQFAANLKTAYDRLRTIHPRRLLEKRTKDGFEMVETNPMRVLFYPKSFDFREYDLGVTYNENWMDEIERFGHEREHMIYSSLVNHAEAVAHSWRDGPRVPPLPAVAPKFKLGEKVVVPIEVNCELQAIVLANGSLDDFFDSDGETPLTLYAVTSEGLEVWSYREWEWHQVLN